MKLQNCMYENHDLKTKNLKNENTSTSPDPVDSIANSKLVEIIQQKVPNCISLRSMTFNGKKCSLADPQLNFGNLIFCGFWNLMV